MKEKLATTETMKELRTVIVDDSALARLLLRDAFARIPGVRVVGNASEGQAALDVIDATEPDLVTLDVEMPGINGIELLRRLKQRHPRLRVLMCSRLVDTDATVANDALLYGAFDVVSKPTGRNRDENVRELRAKLAERIGPLLDLRSPNPSPALMESKAAPAVAARVSGAIESRGPSKAFKAKSIDIVIIGSSTGGPAALRKLLAGLDRDLRVPVCIVQHIPQGFSKPLAQRLDQNCPLTVVEAEEAMLIEPQHVYLAPGGKHLLIERSEAGNRLRLGDGEPEHGCRPAIDVTLRSTLEVYGSNSLVVILTGMGRDGAVGANFIRSLGGHVFVQSPDTSTVSSMPRQALETSGADFVGSLEELARMINQTVGG